MEKWGVIATWPVMAVLVQLDNGGSLQVSRVCNNE